MREHEDQVAEVMHGVRLGQWARECRESLNLLQDQVAHRMSEVLSADIDPNWVTQLETGRKKRAIQQPYLGALVEALESSEEVALRACGLLTTHEPREGDMSLAMLSKNERAVVESMRTARVTPERVSQLKTAIGGWIEWDGEERT